jgi:glycosyltransferase involved in cell wall biosynthesis
MKIAFDHQAFCIQKYGGVSRYYVRLVQELLDIGEEVGVFAPIHRNKHLSDLPKDVVHGRYLEKYPPKSSKLFMAYNRWLARRDIGLWNPRVVHETYYARQRSGPKESPTVVTVHDMIHELYPEYFGLRNETKKLKHKAVMRADHVVCVSENTRQDLIGLLDVSPEKVSVIYHGFDSHVASETKNKAEFSVTEAPYLLYVGNRGKYKNFISFIKAFASSASLKEDFEIVSFGGAKFSTSERSLMAELGISGLVMHVEGNDSLLGDLYKYATACVYPSIYEGFGLPLLEAMAHGCPVIASNKSSIPEVVGDAGELFEPLDVDAISEAIERVVYSDELRTAYIQRGFERLKQFSWRRTAEKTLAVYQKVAR